MSEFGIDWDIEDGSGLDEAGDDPFAAEYAFDFAAVDTALPDFVDSDLLDSDLLDSDPVGELLDGAYELLGADPDEEELWNQIMLDLNDEVNPYVSN